MLEAATERRKGASAEVAELEAHEQRLERMQLWRQLLHKGTTKLEAAWSTVARGAAGTTPEPLAPGTVLRMLGAPARGQPEWEGVPGDVRWQNNCS